MLITTGRALGLGGVFITRECQGTALFAGGASSEAEGHSVAGTCPEEAAAKGAAVARR